MIAHILNWKANIRKLIAGSVTFHLNSIKLTRFVQVVILISMKKVWDLIATVVILQIHGSLKMSLSFISRMVLPLLGSHVTSECVECHKSASLLKFNPLGVECINCHEPNYLATTNPVHSSVGVFYRMFGMS